MGNIGRTRTTLVLEELDGNEAAVELSAADITAMNEVTQVPADGGTLAVTAR